ncbi:MAG: hypothetical protein JWO86_2413, partial [Myxococcaceae bacterium]|nr:hypothetical protein [Myxococcaceae bacterium]
RVCGDWTVTPGSRNVVTVHDGGGLPAVPVSKSPFVQSALAESRTFPSPAS